MASAPAFDRDPTFLGCAPGDFDSLPPDCVAVVGAPFDTATPERRGSRHAPGALRVASRDAATWLAQVGAEPVVDVTTCEERVPALARPLVDLGDLNTFPSLLERTGESYRAGITALAREGAIPLILGGDGWVTLPALRGLRDASSGRVALIRLSASLSAASPTPAWGEEWAGSTIRGVVENDLVDPGRIALIGASGWLPAAESEWAAEHGVTVVPAGEVRRAGAGDALAAVLASVAAEADRIYLSIGMDALDSAWAPGTGATVIGGLAPRELVEAVRSMAKDTRMSAIDLVELSPELDVTGKTTRAAVATLLECLLCLRPPRPTR